MNIYDANDIKRQVSLVRYFTDQNVPLRNGGTRAVAVWRGGKNPSVSINADDGVWYDHVAGAGGTIIDAFVAIEGGTPLSAICALGDRYGITPIKTTRAPRKLTRGEMLINDGFALAKTYTYTDEEGNALYFVDRYEKQTKDGKREKSFVQRSPTAENLDGVRRVLYNLPAVIRADRVFIVEGEKDCETLRRMNLVATTNSGGGKYWQEDFNAVFEGKDVVIIPDNDEVGKTHADTLVAQLHPIARAVKVVRPSKLPKGDVTDWMEREGGNLTALLEMVDAAPVACAKADADVLRAKLLNLTPLMNYDEVHLTDGKTRFDPRHVNAICAEIRARFLNFPRKLGEDLFDYTRNSDPAKRRIMTINTPMELKAWANGTSGQQSVFKGGGNFAGWDELFARLRQTAPAYNSIAHAPWYPMRTDVFFVHPQLPPADPTHARFWELLDFFNPATPADRTLMAAFFCAPMYFDGVSSRPAWCVDTIDAQASGKSAVVKACAAIYDEEVLDLDLKTVNGDLNQMKKRVLSAEGRSKRIALLDNVDQTLKSGNLAQLVTASAVTGMKPYGHGEETRINDLTWAITVNGASVDTDMATRTYTIHIHAPRTYIPRWENKVRDFIVKYRAQIHADMLDMLAHAPERIRNGSRFATFDAVVLSAVCATDEEFLAAAAKIETAAESANEDIDRADELNDLILNAISQFGEDITGIKPGMAWVLRPTDLDEILRSSSGALRNWTAKRVRRLVKQGNAPQFVRDFDRINTGEMRRLSGQARAFCFMPNDTIPRTGTVMAQLVKFENHIPKAACTEPISL